MLRNYIKIALRNIWANKTFSLINIIGLSVSMSLGLLIILVVKSQYAFDNFHQDADRIYRINTRALRVSGGTEPYASTPYPLGIALKNDYSFTEEVVLLQRQLNNDAAYGNVVVPIYGLFAENSFLKVFNFRLEKGDPATALSSPESLVLTQESAKKLFGNEEPMGKTVELKGFGNFVVTGILSKFPGPTHFEFEALASAAALPLLEKQSLVSKSMQEWTNYYSTYTYFKLKPGRTEKEVNDALADIAKKHYAGVKLETRDKGYQFYLQPLNKISPSPMLSNKMGNALPEEILLFLTILATAIMIMAGLNYTSLTIAKSLKRAREIGVRKVMGASRRQVFFQFIGESIVFCVVALFFSWVLLQFLKISFLQLHLTQEYSIDLNEGISAYALFFAFAAIVGIIAGLLPSAFLSGFKPVLVMKNMISTKVNTRFNFRKVLMVFQFVLSLVFVICVLFIYSQVKYMLTADYGIAQTNIFNLRLKGNDYKKMAVEVGNIAGVKRVGAVSHSLGTSADRASDYKRHKADEPFVMRDFCADDNYLKNLEVKFLAGRNFRAGLSAEKESEVILNETALKTFKFKDAASALNQTIYVDDSIQLQVVGVLKDFHFRNFEYPIGPIAFRYKPAEFRILSIAIEPNSTKRIASSIQSAWKKIDPVHQVRLTTMEYDIDETYVNMGFVDILKIVGYIAFLAITIACLGLLGMVMYSTQLKTKEIGVRKVLGASVKDITLLLSRSFAILIVIGLLIGIPLGYFMGNFLLENFAYRISHTNILIVLATAILVVLGLVTICSQTIKAAVANPVKSLRTE